MQTERSRGVRRVLVMLLGVVLAGMVRAKPAAPTLLSESQWLAHVTSLLTWDDHAIVGWYGGPEGQKVVRLQRLGSTLDVWSRPIPLTDATHEAYEPRLARSGNQVVVAWYEKQAESGESVAMIAQLNWSGQPLWYHVLSHPGRDGRDPVVRTTADGSWVAWLEKDDDGGTGVWLEHLSVGGEPLSPAQRAGTADPDTANLNAAVDAAGQFFVVFDAKLGTRARELQLVTAGPQGVQHHALTRDDGADSVFPDIAIDNGHAALCWVDARGGERAVLLAVGSPAELDSPRDERASVLTRAQGDVGGSYLAWNRDQLGVTWNLTGENAGLYLQRFDVRGHPAGAPVRLARPAGAARAAVPSIAPWKRGFGVAWNEYTTDEAQHRVLSSTAFVLHSE